MVTKEKPVEHIIKPKRDSHGYVCSCGKATFALENVPDSVLLTKIQEHIR